MTKVQPASPTNGRIPRRGDRVGMGQRLGVCEVVGINSLMHTANVKSTDGQGRITRNVPWTSLGELHTMHTPTKEVVVRINMASERILVWQSFREKGFRCTDCAWDSFDTNDRRTAEREFDNHTCAKYPISAQIKII
jgi:hypothetical protein